MIVRIQCMFRKTKSREIYRIRYQEYVVRMAKRVVRALRVAVARRRRFELRMRRHMAAYKIQWNTRHRLFDYNTRKRIFIETMKNRNKRYVVGAFSLGYLEVSTSTSPLTRRHFSRLLLGALVLLLLPHCAPGTPSFRAKEEKLQMMTRRRRRIEQINFGNLVIANVSAGRIQKWYTKPFPSLYSPPSLLRPSVEALTYALVTPPRLTVYTVHPSHKPPPWSHAGTRRSRPSTSGKSARPRKWSD